MIQIIGRSSSHFTRVVRIFAHEVGVPVELGVVHDMLSTATADYGDNPARKMPTLRRSDGSLIFGAENICRALADMASPARRIVWPEQLRSDTARNAHEMLSHAMSAQTQLVFGVLVNKLPADNVYFAKGREGFIGALQWLDTHLTQVLAAMPERDVSMFEVMLFALIEHLKFRVTAPLEPFTGLAQFAAAFGTRPSARATPYVFDVPPA